MNFIEFQQNINTAMDLWKTSFICAKSELIHEHEKIQLKWKIALQSANPYNKVKWNYIYNNSKHIFDIEIEIANNKFQNAVNLADIEYKQREINAKSKE